MRKPRIRPALGEAPPQRRPARPPKSPPTRPVPKGDPLAQTPPRRAVAVPKARGVGKPPNPRTPALVRHTLGGALKDLFELFPDLPRPARPRRRARPSR